MKVKCINNTASVLRSYDFESVSKEKFDRFGASISTEYNEIQIGKEYLVMGIIVFQRYQGYLIDDNSFITVCPGQLFEIIDDTLRANWPFRLIGNNEDIYPFVQAIFGYYELCDDKKAYEKLIVEMDEKAQGIYFNKKIELENVTDGETLNSF